MDSIENVERKLTKLKNDVELLQKRMSENSEPKDNSIEEKLEFKNNRDEIKQLKKEVGELQTQLKTQKTNEIQIVEETIRQKCKDLKDLKASSAKEFLEKLESRVLDLSVKAESQLHYLKHLERTFNEENNLFKKMTETCTQDDVSTEAECIQKIRQFENANRKLQKTIEESENENDKMKKILNNVLKKNAGYLDILKELKNEQAAMSQNKNKEHEEVIYPETKECNDVNLKKKEKELEKLKSEILIIKDTVYCQNVHDIDSTFLELKSTNKDLTEMAKKAERRLIELKEEKRNLASKRALMKEVDSVYPKSDENIVLTKTRQQEQEKRLDIAKEEMDRINSHINKTKDVFQKLIVKMNPKVNETEMKKKDLKQLSKQFENVVKYAFPPVDTKCSSKIMK